MPCVTPAQFFGKSYQRGAVVNGIDATEARAGQGKDVADEYIDVGRGVSSERSDFLDSRFKTKLGEELVNGDGAQFGASDPVTFGKEPANIERLSAERHEHARAV